MLFVRKLLQKGIEKLNLYKMIVYGYYNINLVNMVQKHIKKASYACMVSPADKAGCPAKVVWPIALFSNSKHHFVQLLCQPLASQHCMVSD